MIFKGRVEEKYNYQPEVIISTIYFFAKFYTLPNSLNSPINVTVKWPYGFGDKALDQWFSNLSVHQYHQEDLLKQTGPTPRVSESVDLGW